MATITSFIREVNGPKSIKTSDDELKIESNVIEIDQMPIRIKCQH